jgi:hypothetical protein
MTKNDSVLMVMDMRDRVVSLLFAGILVVIVAASHLWCGIDGYIATIGLGTAGFLAAYAVTAGRIYRRNVLRSRAQSCEC